MAQVPTPKPPPTRSAKPARKPKAHRSPKPAQEEDRRLAEMAERVMADKTDETIPFDQALAELGHS